MPKLPRKSLELTAEQFATLDKLAEQLNEYIPLTPGVGPTPTHPSWRILIREIANGKIVCEPALWEGIQGVIFREIENGTFIFNPPQKEKDNE